MRLNFVIESSSTRQQVLSLSFIGQVTHDFQIDERRPCNWECVTRACGRVAILSRLWWTFNKRKIDTEDRFEFFFVKKDDFIVKFIAVLVDECSKRNVMFSQRKYFRENDRRQF